jgi:hypothetical protein
VGRQVGFFSFPADVAALETFVIDRNQSVIIRGIAPDPAPQLVPALRLEPDDPGRSDLLIVRPADLPRLRWRHVPGRDLWRVDTDTSPALEYLPGYGRDGQPWFVSSARSHGRLWFQSSHWEDGQLVRADPEFAAWAGRAFRWIRKEWILIGHRYFSPEAARLWRSMWSVVFDEPWEGPGSEQFSRWRRQYDPGSVLPPEDVRAEVTRATRGAPRRLVISVRVPVQP